MNNKHILFIDNLIKYKFNQTKAYMETYPDSQYNSARVDSSKLLTNPNVKNLLDDRLKDIDIKKYITIEYVLKKLQKFVETCNNESDGIRATELLGKYLAMFTDKQEVTGKIDFTTEEREELKLLRSRISSPTVN